MAEQTAISILAFEPRHAEAFAALNIAWVERFFTVEDKDREQLHDAKARILDKGGAILIAEDETGDAVGCVALVPHGEGEVELAKMAVAESAQGRGVGRRLMEAALEQAREMGCRSVYLESNHVLVPAITLYERSGFRHLAPGERPVSPYARCDVYMRRAL